MDLKPQTIHFLIDLSLNNNRKWFEDNRPAYEAAKTDFIQLVQYIIDTVAQQDPSIKDLKAKDCLFRINRDTRFSKDKSPYKTNFGASINFDGRKSMSKAGYYIHLEPGKSFVGGGLYMPPNDTVQQIRTKISQNFKQFEAIVNEPSFKAFFNQLSFEEAYTLKKTPKGFQQDDAAGPYLKLKSFLAIRAVEDEALTDDVQIETIIQGLKSLEPLITFINQATQT